MPRLSTHLVVTRTGRLETCGSKLTLGRGGGRCRSAAGDVDHCGHAEAGTFNARLTAVDGQVVHAVGEDFGYEQVERPPLRGGQLAAFDRDRFAAFFVAR